MTVTPDVFRNAALSLEGAVEGAHMGHAEFRGGGRIFATLGYPDPAWGVAMLTPDEQPLRVDSEPEAFEPVPGWGRAGSARIRLAAAVSASLAGALASAWQKAHRKIRAGQGLLGAAKNPLRTA